MCTLFYSISTLVLVFKDKLFTSKPYCLWASGYLSLCMLFLVCCSLTRSYFIGNTCQPPFLTTRPEFSAWALKVIKNVMQSMALSIGYGLTFSSLMCFLRNRRKKDGEANPFIAGAAAGLWIACEPPSRRIELTRIAFKDVPTSSHC